MSWEAVTWATRQAMSCDGSQLVLMLLANWADPEGFLKQVKVANLVRPGRQSERSIYRRLDELERCGLFSREKIGHRSGGAPIIVGRLHLDRFYDFDVEPEGRTEGENDAENSPENSSERVCQIGSASGGSATGGSEALPLVAVPIDNLTLNQKGSTTTTLESHPGDATGGEGGGGTEESGGREAERALALDTGWRRLIAAYPTSPSMDLVGARGLFEALTIADRALAIRAAGDYRADLKARHRDHAIDLAKWLRERRFVDIAAVAASGAAVAAAAKGVSAKTVFVAKGTRGWDAWVAYRRARGEMPPCDHSKDPQNRGRTGWWFESAFPPGSSEHGPPGGEQAA